MVSEATHQPISGLLDCDNQIHNNATKQASQGCDFTCPGNTTETCGGSDLLSIFTKTLGAVVVQQFSGALPGVWNLVGSFRSAMVFITKIYEPC